MKQPVALTAGCAVEDLDRVGGDQAGPLAQLLHPVEQLPRQPRCRQPRLVQQGKIRQPTEQLNQAIARSFLQIVLI